MNLATLVDVLNSVKTHNTGFADLNPAYWDPALFTQEFHRSLVRFHWSAAQHVPPNCLDNGLFTEIVLKDPDSIHVVPEHCLYAVLNLVFTDRDARIADIVMQRPAAWLFVPINLRRDTLLKCITKAPDRVSDLLAVVPEEYLDHDVCLAAMELHACDNISVWQGIPVRHRTRELCRVFIYESECWLKDLPPELQFDNMRLEMALAGAALIDEVPEHLRTQDVYECANFRSLEEIPEINRSQPLCMRALGQSGNNLSYVPEPLISHELVLQAVTTTGTALALVPEAWIDQAVVAAALISDPVATAWVPEPFREIAEFTEAAQMLIGQFEQIPANQLNDAFVTALVTAEGRLIMEIPWNFHTPAICQLAFESPDLHLVNFPEHMKSRAACVASVQRSWRSLRRVPNQYLIDGDLPNICETAIYTDPYAFQFVPDNHPELEALHALAIQLGLPPENGIRP